MYKRDTYVLTKNTHDSAGEIKRGQTRYPKRANSPPENRHYGVAPLNISEYALVASVVGSNSPTHTESRISAVHPVLPLF